MSLGRRCVSSGSKMISSPWACGGQLGNRRGTQTPPLILAFAKMLAQARSIGRCWMHSLLSGYPPPVSKACLPFLPAGVLFSGKLGCRAVHLPNPVGCISRMRYGPDPIPLLRSLREGWSTVRLVTNRKHNHFWSLVIVFQREEHVALLPSNLFYWG